VLEVGKKDRVRPSRPCDNCGINADTQFRIRCGDEDTWRIVCKACQERAKASNGYMYGGTWKRKKRN
jgi:hypothetical protein